MNTEVIKQGTMAGGENMFRSIYTKSMDVKNFLTTWKESMLASANFDLSQALQEKAAKMQTAMCIQTSNNVKEKEAALEALETNLKATKADYDNVKGEHDQIMLKLQNIQNENQQAKAEGEKKVLEGNRLIEAFKAKLSSLETSHEKAKHEILNTIKVKDEQIESFKQQAERLIKEKESLQNLHKEQEQDCVTFFSKAIQPLELTKQEIVQEKLALQEKIQRLQEWLNQTREERDMLSEDLASHLEEHKETVLIIEEVNFHIESLEAFAAEKDIERDYYIDLLQRIFEEVCVDKEVPKLAEEMAGSIMESIVKEKITSNMIEENIAALCKSLNIVPDKEKLKKRKEGYIKLRNDALKAYQAELALSYNYLQKIEATDRSSINYIENTLRPSIHVLETTLPEYKEKCGYMKRQLSALLEAEADVTGQIMEWNERKTRQVETMLNSHAKTQIEGIDHKLREIYGTMQDLNNEISQYKTDMKNLEETHAKAVKEISENIYDKETEIENKTAEYEKTYKEWESEINILNSTATSLSKQMDDFMRKITSLELQLEDAKQSYKSAKDAELTAKKLQTVRNIGTELHHREKHNRSISLDLSGIKAEEIICGGQGITDSEENDDCGVEIGKEDDDEAEIEFPEVVCLPLQQSAASKVARPKQIENSITSTSLSLHQTSNATEHSQENKFVHIPESLQKSNDVPSTRHSSVCLKLENKENKASKYQKYITNNICKGTKSGNKTKVRTTRVDSIELPANPFRSVQDSSKNWANQLWCPKQSAKGELAKNQANEFSFSLCVPDISQSASNSVMQSASFLDPTDLLKSESAGMSKNSAVLARLVEQLLKGHKFYKKFSTKYSAKLPAFDPLKAKICPPSHCGYGLRHLSLSYDFANIVISGTGGDLVVPIRNVVKPIVPQQTIEIIRAQKIAKEGIASKIAAALVKNDAGIGRIIESSKLKEYEKCEHYPFSFELAEKGKLELIATDYRELKVWVVGIGLLTKNKKLDDMLPTREYI